MAKTYSLGLTLTAPAKGDTNWAPVEDAKNTRLSLHDHSGGGLGTPIGTGALAANSVDATKIRLGNNAPLRARNALDSADLNLFRLSSGNLLDFQTAMLLGSGSQETISSGAVSVSTILTILNSATTYTLANGVRGQLKIIYCTSSASSTITNGTSSFVVGSAGTMLLWASGVAGSWAHVGGSAMVTTTETFSAIGTWSGNSKHVRCTGTTYTVSMPTNPCTGQYVFVENAASGNVTFGGAVMATLTYYLYTYLNGAWRRVALA